MTLIAVMPLALTVIGPESGVYDESLQEGRKTAIRRFSTPVCASWPMPGLSARGELVIRRAVTEITSCARRIKANLIVVGHKHLEGWAARWWRGSISKALIEHAPCSVLVVITH